MPNRGQTCLTVDRLSWHVGDCGSPIRRNHPSNEKGVLHPAVAGSRIEDLPEY